MTSQGDSPEPTTTLFNASGKPATLMKFEKISAPIRTKKRIADVRALSMNTSSNAFDGTRRTSASTKAPPAPIPAASLAVKAPA